MKTGNCYVTCEALYHLLGGKRAGLKPMYVKHEGGSHWFLVQRVDITIMGHFREVVLDPTVSQFKTKPDYSKAKGKGFLTKKPSKRAKELMKKLLWSEK